MDSHVFRRLCDELVPALLGSRVEKIHQPAHDVIMFTLYGHGAKSWLFLRFDRRQPFLFLTSQRVSVGIAPPASIMRLRKYLGQQRFIDARVLWPERRLFLRVHAPASSRPPADTDRPLSTLYPDSTDPSQVWLELNLREGAILHVAAPEDLPPASQVTPEADDALWPPLPLPPTQDIWRQWPVLSPALRRILALVDPGEQAALLGDLRTGGGDVLVYEGADGQRELSAWPLPEPLRAARGESLYESALQAAAQVGETLVLQNLAVKNREAAAKPYHVEATRLKRLLGKLHTEETRLTAMANAQKIALALQAELYRFAPDAKCARLELVTNTPEFDAGNGQNTQMTLVELNPALTVRENMTALFHKAGRGKRGLTMLVERVRDVQRQLELTEQDGRMAEAATGATATPLTPASPTLRGAGAHRGLATPGKKSHRAVLPRSVQAFRSHDGFLLLRGRDAKGNALLLKLGAPHDLWLHTGGGAGAHVLVRRDHAAQHIPEQTLREAGNLAVLKSERKDENEVDVIGALVKYVHPIKGARAGAVRIDRTEITVLVTPDRALEQELTLTTDVPPKNPRWDTTGH